MRRQSHSSSTCAWCKHSLRWRTQRCCTATKPYLASKRPLASLVSVHATIQSRNDDGVSPHLSIGKASQTLPAITKSDEAFAKEGIDFVWGHEDIDVPELNNLFERVGFPRRNAEKLQIALQCTHTTVWLRCNRTSRWAREGQLLGFARADSDGELTATIWDVAVHPAWRRMGLGRALMERVVHSLLSKHVDIITLYAEPNVVLLYEKLGFQSAKEVQDMRALAFQKTSQEGRALIAATLAA